MKPLLVGEMNPYGADPDFALYHLPRRATGDRLRAIMGLGDVEYLQRFDRVNLCVGKWNIRGARLAVSTLLEQGRPVIVLLGAKVCAAFGLDFVPFRVLPGGASGLPTRVILPHPSGLSRAWNDPSAPERARQALREAQVLA